MNVIENKQLEKPYSAQKKKRSSLLPVPIEQQIHHRQNDQRDKGRKAEAKNDRPRERAPERDRIAAEIDLWVASREKAHKIDVETDSE